MSAQVKTGSNAGSGCLTLFGGVFALAGGLAIYSVLNSDERGSGLLAGLGVGGLFLAIGVGVMVFSRWAARAHNEGRELESRYPDEPWRWRKDWESGRIESGSKTEMIFSWFFALFWNAISTPALVFGWEELQGDWVVLGLVALFPLVGIGLLGWAIKSSLRYAKFGTSELRLRSTPGVIGGRLEGDVYCAVRRMPKDGALVSLTCIRQVPDSDGTSERLIWESEKRISTGALGRDSRGMRIPVEFTIPSDCEESKETVGNTGSGIEWRLNVMAEVEGVDFAAQFEVPVFRTAASRDDVREQDGVTDAFGRSEVDFNPADATFIERPSPMGGVEYYFPPARNRGAAIGLSVFLLFWLGALIPMLHFGIPWFFIIVWGLFALLLVYVAAAMWVERVWIRVEDGKISVRSSMPLAGGTRSLSFGQVDRISTAIGMSQSGSATQRAKAWHNIEIHPKQGKPLRADVHLADKQEALWLIRRLEASIKR